MAADVTDGLTAETLQGSTVTFSVVDGVVKINDATVTATDIEASNGVIHVIDTVITPPAAEAAEVMVEEVPAEAAPEAMVEEMPAEAAPAEEMAAPATLPVTGASSSSNYGVIVAMVVLGLLAAAFAMFKAVRKN